MSADAYEVVVGAGTLRSDTGTTMAHRWTPDGVTVDAPFTGAHLFHLAAAGCVLNDLYREAVGLGIELDGVRVRARGGFDTSTWTSTGIVYDVEVESTAADDRIAALIAQVDDVAEIPKALRSGTTVHRIGDDTD